MPKFFKEHFVHFVFFVFEAAFSYLHKRYDFYYDLDCQTLCFEHNKEVNKDA